MWVLILYKSNLVLNGFCLFANSCVLYEQFRAVIVINIMGQPVVVLMVNSVIIYRNNKALESCGNARNSLQSTLQRVRPEG